MEEENQFRDYSLLSRNEIYDVMKSLSKNKTSVDQTLFIIKSLLITSVEKEYVLDNIKSLISCSSHDFCELCPIFDKILDDDTTLAHSILKILPSFDYDDYSENHARSISYRLALKIGHIIEEDGLNEWIHFLLFCTKKQNVPEVYEILKETLTANPSPELFKTFENGVRRHLSLFYSILTKQNSWQLFDFFIFVVSFSRPSLRTKNQKLFWDSVLLQKLSIDDLSSFFTNHDILDHLFQYVTTFIVTVLVTPPKYITISMILPFTNVLLTIFKCFPEYSNRLVEELLSFALNGQSFASSVSCLTLLKVSPEIISKSVPFLDDSISQTTIIPISTLQVMSAIIARAVSPEMRSMIYISIQKKLLHHSQVLVQTGVSLALHFNRIDCDVSEEIISWVLRSMKQNALILKPSVLLSVIDLFYESRTDANIDAFCDFVLNLVTNFKLIVPTKSKPTTSDNPLSYSISCKTVDSRQQAELCGELIVLVSTLTSKLGKCSFSSSNAKMLASEACLSMSDLTKISFVIPHPFAEYMKDHSKFPKLIAPKLKRITVMREMIIAILSREMLMKGQREEFISLLEIIDDVYETELENNRRCLLETGVFWPSYIFKVLLNEQFSFPEDIFFVTSMLHSLYEVFVHPSPTQRYFFDDRFEYIESKVPDTIPLRVITICSALLEMLETDKEYVNSIISSVAHGLDFVTLCVISSDFKITYDEDILPLLELTSDVGIACRIILLGYHMKYRKENLVDIMKHNPATKFVSDLSSNIEVYPPSLPNIEKIVKPSQQGANWRLILYLSLLSPSFDEFYSSFKLIIDQINSQEIAAQYSYVLCDALIARMNDWEEIFEPFTEMSTLTMKLIFNDDVYSLNSASSLLSAVLQLQGEEGSSPFSQELHDFIYAKIHGINVAGAKKKVAYIYRLISMQCEQINHDATKRATPQINEESGEYDEEEDGTFKVDESSASDDFSSSSESTSD